MSRRCRDQAFSPKGCGCQAVATQGCTKPCEEPLVYGANILRDPGVELQLANWGGGPNNDEIPYFPDATPWSSFFGVWESYWPSNDSATNLDDMFWAQEGPVGGITFAVPTIATTSPHAGTYHVSWVFAGGTTYTRGSIVYPVRRFCADTKAGFTGIPAQTPRFYTARVEPGNFIKWSGYFKSANGDGAPKVSMRMGTRDDLGGSSESFYNDNQTLTTSYAEYSVSAFAPSTAKFVQVWCYITKTGTLTNTIYGDGFAFEVSA